MRCKVAQCGGPRLPLTRSVVPISGCTVAVGLSGIQGFDEGWGLAEEVDHCEAGQKRGQETNPVALLHQNILLFS